MLIQRSSSVVDTSPRASRPLEHVEEAALIKAAALGEHAAFEEIVRRHNQVMFRTARSILKSDEDAEDAVQDAYLRAWRGLPKFRGGSKLSTWLVRIVSNEALGQLRRARARTFPLEEAMTHPDPDVQLALAAAPESGPEQEALRAETRSTVEGHIDGLPDEFRTVFMLRAVEEWSSREVAEALGIAEATVRTRYFRARKLLQEALTVEAETALPEAFGFDGARCDRMTANVMRLVEAVPQDE